LRKAFVVTLAALLLVSAALGVVYLRASKAESRLERSQANASRAAETVAGLKQDSSLEWSQHIAHLSSLEPKGDAAVIGVYRARIVDVGRDGTITFDWLGYVPNPHGSTRTNASRHSQALRGDPLGFIKIRQPLKSGRLSSAVFPDTLESMRSRDATGKALLQSDWWVGVSGPNWVELVQAD